MLRSDQPLTTEITISRATWLRIRPDGSEPILGLQGEEAQEAISLFSVGDRGSGGCCFMGFIMKQAYGFSDEELRGVDYPSKFGVTRFMGSIASVFNNTSRLEREIAVVTDRKGPYATYSEREIKLTLVAMAASAGFRIRFVD